MRNGKLIITSNKQESTTLTKLYVHDYRRLGQFRTIDGSCYEPKKGEFSVEIRWTTRKHLERKMDCSGTESTNKHSPITKIIFHCTMYVPTTFIGLKTLLEPISGMEISENMRVGPDQDQKMLAIYFKHLHRVQWLEYLYTRGDVQMAFQFTATTKIIEGLNVISPFEKYL